MKKLYTLLAAAVVASGAAYAAPAKLKAELKLMQPTTEAPAMLKDFSDVTARKAPSRAEVEDLNIAGNYTCYYSVEDSEYADNKLVFTAKGDNKYNLNYLILSAAANVECEVKYFEKYWENGEDQWAVIFDGTTPVFYEDLSDYASYGFTSHEPFYIGLTKDGRFSTMQEMQWIIEDNRLLWIYAEGYALVFYSRIIEGIGALTYTPVESPNFYLQNTKMTTKELDKTGAMVEHEYNFYSKLSETKDGMVIRTKGFAGWYKQVSFVVDAEDGLAIAPYQVIYSNETYGDFYITSSTESMYFFTNLSAGEDGNTVMTIAKPWFVYSPTAEMTEGFYSDTKVYLPFNALGSAGVKEVENDVVDGPAVYYDLQGRQVQNPAAGLYIVRRGNKTSKVLVK